MFTFKKSQNHQIQHKTESVDNARIDKIHKNKGYVIQATQTDKSNKSILHHIREKLKKYKSTLTHLIRKTKQDYYKSQFTKYTHDCKNTWKLLNEVAGRKAKKSDPPSYFKKLIHRPNNQQPVEIKLYDNKTIANEFNLYFANVGYELSNKIKYSGKK